MSIIQESSSSSININNDNDNERNDNNHSENSNQTQRLDHNAIDSIVERISDNRSQPRMYDFIFMDVNMPVMDGFEATSKINEMKSQYSMLKTCKIIINTAYTSKDDEVQAQKCKADAFIRKPFSIKQICETLIQLKN